MYKDILYEVEEPVAIVTFNRPDRLNALTSRMYSELKHAFAEAERDERVVGIILTGAGRGFSAGADMQGLSTLAGASDSGDEVGVGRSGNASLEATITQMCGCCDRARAGANSETATQSRSTAAITAARAQLGDQRPLAPHGHPPPAALREDRRRKKKDRGKLRRKAFAVPPSVRVLN